MSRNEPEEDVLLLCALLCNANGEEAGQERAFTRIRI
jgi:hypothetical protein